MNHSTGTQNRSSMPLNVSHKSEPDRGRRPPPLRSIRAIAWIYLVAVAGTWALAWWAGERWWPATLILFGPRWVLAVPAIFLIVPVIIFRQWLALARLIVAGAIIAGPLMGFNVPWRRLAPAAPGIASPTGLRVLTCNVHDVPGHDFSRQKLAQVIATENVDLVALQEWGGGADSPAVSGPRWHVLTEGDLRLESRWPLRRVAAILPDPGWVQGGAVAIEVSTPRWQFRFINLHLASPHEAISLTVRRPFQAAALLTSNSHLRNRQAAAIASAAFAAGNGVVLAGDFNLPSDSLIYRQELSGLADAFMQGGWGFGWTYHRRGTALRIDHVLTGSGWVCRRCWVGPNIGSPHSPLIAELRASANSNQSN
ncbi:MAG TPA: endonuclease/exonuclease/phosphatase family protein [Tepidisphaeraceae bacterium]|jgi:endonuclease/exonuclease/phosphatase family metal-dependent hydrolase|nr:endonuclease/exonuclease/phosphatase family protein [Tepidisphaeraceae bacterium]